MSFQETPIGQMRLRRLREEFGWPHSDADLPGIYALLQRGFDADAIARLLELSPPEQLVRDLVDVGEDVRDIPPMPGAGGDLVRNRPRQSDPATRFYWRQIRGMPEQVEKARPSTGPPSVGVAWLEVLNECKAGEADPDYVPTFGHPRVAEAFSLLGGFDGIKQRGPVRSYGLWITTYKDLIAAPASRPSQRSSMRSAGREPDASEPTTPAPNSERSGGGLRSVKELLPNIPERERYPEDF